MIDPGSAMIATSVIGGLFGAAGQSSANRTQIDLANTQYQRQVKDLQAAGLNPMLGIAKGSGGAPVPQIQNEKASIAQALMNSAQVGLLQAQRRKANAEASVTEQFGVDQAKADLDRTLASTGLTSAQIAQASANTDNLIAQLQNIKDENAKIKRAAELIFQQTNESWQRQITEAQRADLVRAQVKQVIASTELSNLDIDAAKALDNLGRQAKELKPIIEIFKMLMGRR